MRIGVVSDTHMSAASKLPEALRKGLEGVDAILHLGDFMAPVVADWLEDIAPLEAVAGNNDGEEIIRRFGRKKIVELGGIRIGMVHGDGPGSKPTERRAEEAFYGDEVEVILFGHSHIPYLRQNDRGVWLFNPGSPWDKRRQPRYSFGLLHVEGEQIRAEHVFYEERG